MLLDEQTLLYIHVGSVAIAIGAVLYADKIGFAWIRGSVATTNPQVVNWLHRTVSVALCCIVVSGLMLAWPAREYLLSQPLFLLKMLFVAGLVVNSFFIGKLKDISIHQPFSSVPESERRALFVSGAVSTVCWFGAITAAFFFFGWLF